MLDTPVAETTNASMSMLQTSGPVGFAVLLILLGLSVVSWAIAIQKVLQFSAASKASEAFTKFFWETKNFGKIDEKSGEFSASPLVPIFASGYKELLQIAEEGSGKDFATVEHTLKKNSLLESRRLERGMTFLASVATSAPFIGLFGTVWGIMTAFHGLSAAKSSTIQAVAPGISEALVATAIGLAAAIPASIAYNYFTVSIKNFRQSIDSFCEEFLFVAHRSVNNK